ncbi:MAG: hypothetical protein R3D85_13875 [Paracoccaceae bacterium]|jgi:hypothetical protein
MNDMTHPLPKGAPEKIAIAAVLANATEELGQLARLAGRLDEALGDWILSNPGAPRPPLDLLQNADLLRQSIECFERLFRNLTAEDLSTSDISSSALVRGVFLESIRVSCLRPAV